MAVDLFGVVSPLSDGLRAGFEARFDLQDLGCGILGRVDPVPFCGEPVAGEVLPSLRRIARQVDGGAGSGDAEDRQQDQQDGNNEEDDGEGREPRPAEDA